MSAKATAPRNPAIHDQYPPLWIDADEKTGKRKKMKRYCVDRRKKQKHIPENHITT